MTQNSILTFLTAAAAEYRKFHFCSTLPSSLVVRDLLKLFGSVNKSSQSFTMNFYRTILLIVLRVVRPTEPGAETKIGELNVSFLVD